MKLTGKYNAYEMTIYTDKGEALCGYHVFNLHDELILLEKHIVKDKLYI